MYQNDADADSLRRDIFRGEFSQQHSAKAVGKTDDVAKLVPFFAIDTASHIHGALILVDGGKSL